MDAGEDGPGQNLEETSTDPSEQTTAEGKYRSHKSRFLRDAAHSKDWRVQAKKDFNFSVGEQWEETTAKTMINDEKRVPITFNMCLAIIKAVAGIEINSRHEIYYYPRGTDEGDIVANEYINGVSKWMGQNCDAEDEQSDAFQDTTKCGMGWTESVMDYEEEPDGKYTEGGISPLEMVWDCDARKKNLQDAKRLARVRKMTVSDARALIKSRGGKDFTDADLNCSWAEGFETDTQAINAEERKTRPNNSSPVDPDKDEVYIVHTQWFETENYHRVANPYSGQLEDMDATQLATLNEAAKADGHEVMSVAQTRRVYKQAFLGGKILWEGKGAGGNKFTWQCITGEPHKTKGTWFGLITVLRDPQMMANKWLSQATHIINTTAKGGILAEKKAFPDIREAQRTYANPQAITVVADGAITNGKIMAKPGAGLAAPYLQLMQFAIDALWRVTGMNQEIMGMRDVNQPGILEQQRKQAALTILATAFDALRRYRKNVGRVRLYFMQNYLSDGRIARIQGQNPGTMRAIKIMKDKTFGEYDVIVDDAPTSPNQKEQTFAMLLQLLPAIKDKMSPEATMVFLEYSPLPREAVDKFRKILMSAQQPSPEQQASQRLQIEGAAAKIENLRADTNKKNADGSKSQAEAIIELAQLGVAASAEELNRVKAAAVTAETIHGLMPEPPQDQALFTQDGMDGVPSLPEVPTLPVGPRQPGMVTLDQILPGQPPQ